MLLLALLVLATAAPPNTSFATLPVFSYGADVGAVRTDANIAMLAKMRIVALLQQDGTCWARCCPQEPYGPGCAPAGVLNGSLPLPNASVNPGCDPSCDQLAAQAAIFSRVKMAAANSGRGLPHCMLYVNHVYDWPFDLAHGGGAREVDVVDIHGVPHAEVCDPGIYPSFFTDFGRDAGREAFLSSIRTHVVEGPADGVWLDNFNQVPFNCSRTSTSTSTSGGVGGGGGDCTALRVRNAPVNNASVVTAAQVAAYRKGKQEATTAAVKMVSSTRGVVAAIACNYYSDSISCTRPNSNGASMGYLSQGLVENFRSNITGLVALVDEAYANGYTYLLIEISRLLGVSTTEARAGCIEEVGIAAFLLAAREGCFLQCRGTPGIEIERPIGEPLGRAVVTSDGRMLRRNFSSGVEVWWRLGTNSGGVDWGAGGADTK